MRYVESIWQCAWFWKLNWYCFLASFNCLEQEIQLGEKKIYIYMNRWVLFHLQSECTSGILYWDVFFKECQQFRYSQPVHILRILLIIKCALIKGFWFYLILYIKELLESFFLSLFLSFIWVPPHLKGKQKLKMIVKRNFFFCLSHKFVCFSELKYSLI